MVVKIFLPSREEWCRLIQIHRQGGGVKIRVFRVETQFFVLLKGIVRVGELVISSVDCHVGNGKTDRCCINLSFKLLIPSSFERLCDPNHLVYHKCRACQ